MGKDTLKVGGFSNHCDEERSKLDYYGTDPRSTEALLNVEQFDDLIWEPCAGHHLMVDVLKKHGYTVFATDIAEYDGVTHEKVDFLKGKPVWAGDIITNPPYGLSTEFAIQALDAVQPGHKVAMFLRLLFLEGVKRYETLFKDNPPKTIYVFSNRQVSDKNDDFSKGSAVAYAWIVWEKGYKGDPVIKWLNNSDKK